MKIAHIALVCSSRENGDRFYEDLLGLTCIGTRSVPAELMHRIFGIDLPCTILNYAGDALQMELFVGPFRRPDAPGVEHICLSVGNREAFLARCRELNVAIRKIPKPDGTDLVFITDFDGNRFEIKGE